MTSPQQPRSAQALCQTCGLCCDGTLFGDVKLGPQDAREALYELNASFEAEPQHDILLQPCAAYNHGVCQVYPHRPRTCENFQCKLLHKYVNTTLSWDEASTIIQTTKTQKTRVENKLYKLLGTSKRTNLYNLYEQFHVLYKDQYKTATFRKKYGHLMLLYQGLMLKLRSSFYATESQ